MTEQRRLAAILVADVVGCSCTVALCSDYRLGNLADGLQGLCEVSFFSRCHHVLSR